MQPDNRYDLYHSDLYFIVSFILGMFKCITTVGKSLNSNNSLSSDWSKTFHS